MELTLANNSTSVLSILAFGQLHSKVQVIPGPLTSLKVDDNTVLQGDVNVARFLIRAHKLLDEHTDQRAASLVDILLLNNVVTASDLVEQKTQTFLLSDNAGLVDYLAWSVLSTTTTNDSVKAYVAAIQATPVIQETLALQQQATQEAPIDLATIPGCDPSTNPLDIFKLRIASQLAKVTQIAPEVIYRAIDIPRQLDHGDFALALPRLRVKGNPAQLAKEWAAAFVQTDDYILGATPVGPFLNYRINTRLLIKHTLELASARVEAYGSNASGAGKKAIVEFSSPNIAKPFHAGHLRSTIIGSFIRNVYAANGWDVLAMNYLGDWGKQYGKLNGGRYGNRQRRI